MLNVAILIPTFNSSATIAATLKSVVAQTEALTKVSAVYLADDCSQDESVALAEKDWQADVPLRVISGKRTLGPYRNVNRALDILEQRVDWLLLLHSDDIARPQWLTVMLSRVYACGPKVASICSSWDNLLPDGSIVSGDNRPGDPIRTIEGTVDAVRDTLRQGCWWHISGCAIRMNAYRDIGGFNAGLPHQGDWDWILRCLASGWSIEYVPRTLILYRQHDLSVSSVSFEHDRDIRESLEVVQRYAGLLPRNDLILFHLRRIAYVCRRFVRAATRLRLRRCLRAIATMFLICRSLARSCTE